MNHDLEIIETALKLMDLIHQKAMQDVASGNEPGQQLTISNNSLGLCLNVYPLDDEEMDMIKGLLDG